VGCSCSPQEHSTEQYSPPYSRRSGLSLAT
jgi:hypothetical protein